MTLWPKLDYTEAPYTGEISQVLAQRGGGEPQVKAD